MSRLFSRSTSLTHDRHSARAAHAAGSRRRSRRDCATCELRGGVLMTNGWGYYSSRGGMPMLIVERRPNQRIRINDSIEIVILETEHGGVRLGIESLP